MVKAAVFVILVFLLATVAFWAAIFGVPTVYYAWKQSECWLRGSDSQACWELDLLRRL